MRDKLGDKQRIQHIEEAIREIDSVTLTSQKAKTSGRLHSIAPFVDLVTRTL